MNAINILHASGARLGVEPGLDPRHADERLAAFRCLVEAALARPPVAVLFSGGLLGVARVAASRLEPVELELGRLSRAGIPLVVAASAEESRGREPTALEWLASRGRLQLLAGRRHHGEPSVELDGGLRIVGSDGVSDRGSARPGGSRPRPVLLAATALELTPKQVDSFAYVALGGACGRLELADRVYDPGPLAEAAPGEEPVFLRVQLHNGAPRVQTVASGAPTTEILELDVTGLEHGDAVLQRLKAGRGRKSGRRVHLRLVGEPGWNEVELDRRALAGRVSKLLGGVDVEVMVNTALRLPSGRYLPVDADLELIERAVLKDLVERAPLVTAGAASPADLAADSLGGLLSREDQAREAVAEAIEAYRRTELDRAD